MIDATSSLHFQRGQGLPGRAWLTGEIEALDDLVKDCGFVRREVFAEVGLSRGVALPVHQGDEIHAVLEFFGKNSARVDPEIQRLLKTVGSQIGAAILRKEGAEGRETLRREMMHRAGNSLSILSAIYRNCSRRAASKEDLDEAFLGRITAVGRANRMAIVEGERGVPLSELIMDALGLLPDRDAIELVVSPIVIASEVVMPLSLIFNELGTNALKHGASERGSRLRIKVATCDKSDELIFEWHELRKEPLKARPEQPGRQGFGTQLMRAMIEGRLGGSFERQLDEKGFHFEMRFPRGRLEED